MMVDTVFTHYAAHGMSDGRVHLFDADAIPHGKGWSYSCPVYRFISPKSVREEILEALEREGSEHKLYCLTPKHAIVLYPRYISFEDFRIMRVIRINDGDIVKYMLSAELPFGDSTQRVGVLIDPTQTEPLTVRG